jgi:nucleotide-binding universal stress UspA family protein
MSAADPLMLCYDGSKGAKHAVARAGSLFPAEHAVVLTVWQPISNLGMGSFAWSTASTLVNFAELDRAAADDASRMVAEGVSLAQEAGLEAEPVVVQANGPVWEAIIEAADRYQAAVVVMGSRGLTSLRSMLLGSVSSTVVHHARRPILVIHRNSVNSVGDPHRALERSA